MDAARMCEFLVEDSLPIALVEHEHVIEAFSAERASSHAGGGAAIVVSSAGGYRVWNRSRQARE